MTLPGKIVSAVIVLVVATAALVAQVMHVQEQVDIQDAYTSNAGEITSKVLIGQTARISFANFSGVGIKFATYSNRNNTAPVIFHLRTDINNSTDLRTATLLASDLHDNQYAQFSFEPLPDSAGKTYFFYIESPQSYPGNAVTVDISTQDPYVSGTAYIIRGQGFDPFTIARSGKVSTDLSFTTHRTVTLREAVIHTIVGTYYYVIQTWPTHQGQYKIWFQSLGMAVAFLLLVWFVMSNGFNRLSSRFGLGGATAWVLIGLTVIAFALRYWYSISLPFSDDEGNYLYDAFSLRHGVLAGGDGYVKTPLVVAWITVWQFIFGNGLAFARFSSVLIGTLTIVPIYFLVRELWERKVGLIAAGIWAFFGTAIVFDIYVHTQPLAIFLAISGLAVIIMALRGTTPGLTFFVEDRETSGWGWFFFGGILLGLAVASRKSMLGLGLVPLAWVMLEGRSVKQRAWNFVAIGCGFLLVLALFLGTAYQLYGMEGVQEAAGFNSAADGLAAPDPDEVDKVTAYSLRGMTPFFRESLPLILLFVIGLGLTLEKTVRYFTKKLVTVAGTMQKYIILFAPKVIWLIPIWIFYWAWGFYSEYEGSSLMLYGSKNLWYFFIFVIALIALWPPRIKALVRKEDEPIIAKSTQPLANIVSPQAKTDTNAQIPWRLLSASLTSLLWLGGITFFYEHWIKFHANYLAEFVPPLVITAAAGAAYLWRRIWFPYFTMKDYPLLAIFRFCLVAGVVVVVIWASFISNYITYVYEHTGTFDQKAVQEAADWAKANIPYNQSIFTGAALIPYVSGHHITLDISHPRWYAYNFTADDPKRLNTFLPSAQLMQKAFSSATWVLLEKQTEFSYVSAYSSIEKGLASDFVKVKEIDNGGNPMTFYQRIAPAK